MAAINLNCLFYLVLEYFRLHSLNVSRSLDETQNLIQTDADDAAGVDAHDDGDGSSYSDPSPSLETRTQSRPDNLFHNKICSKTRYCQVRNTSIIILCKVSDMDTLFHMVNQ